MPLCGPFSSRLGADPCGPGNSSPASACGCSARRPGGSSLPRTEDVVVAVVEGAPIQRSELEEVARGLPEQFRQMPMQMLYGVLLDRVIDFRLLSNEAERAGVGDRPGVEEALARARADVLRDALVQQKIEEGTTEERLRELYEGLRQSEDFAREEVHARHILLESEAEAKAVIEELQGGADFAALAQERSTGPSAPNGGDLGYLRARPDGAGVRRGGVRARARRDHHRAGADPVRLACDQADRPADRRADLRGERAAAAPGPRARDRDRAGRRPARRRRDRALQHRRHADGGGARGRRGGPERRAPKAARRSPRPNEAPRRRSRR